MIQETFGGDLIRSPFEMDGPASPGVQEGNPASLEGRGGRRSMVPVLRLQRPAVRQVRDNRAKLLHIFASLLHRLDVAVETLRPLDRERTRTSRGRGSPFGLLLRLDLGQLRCPDPRRAIPGSWNG
jgi:hypothetical protein